MWEAGETLVSDLSLVLSSTPPSTPNAVGAMQEGRKVAEPFPPSLGRTVCCQLANGYHLCAVPV